MQVVKSQYVNDYNNGYRAVVTVAVVVLIGVLIGSTAAGAVIYEAIVFVTAVGSAGVIVITLTADLGRPVFKSVVA